MFNGKIHYFYGDFQQQTVTNYQRVWTTMNTIISHEYPLISHWWMVTSNSIEVLELEVRYFQQVPAWNFGGWSTQWNLMVNLLFMNLVIYHIPLVNIQKTMERSTMFNEKTHYFDWAMFNSFLDVYQRVTQRFPLKIPVFPSIYIYIYIHPWKIPWNIHSIPILTSQISAIHR